MSDPKGGSILAGQVPAKYDDDGVVDLAEKGGIDLPAVTGNDDEALAEEGKEQGINTCTGVETNGVTCNVSDRSENGESSTCERNTLPQTCVEDIDDDDLYRRVREFALGGINAARSSRHVGLLSPDEALDIPAMTHCRTMCEQDFLSHWDIAGRKPYQRYSDFAYGQHVSEAVFEFHVDQATEKKISNRIKECIDERANASTLGGKEGVTNHMLDGTHTHLGIGVYAHDDRLCYVEVYADRYLALLDSPAELSAANAASGFQISVRMASPDFGPYACLVFHDPVATPLTVGELQQQYGGPYSDFTTVQAGIVWPWQMDVLEDGAFGIPVPVSPIEAGTYYVQILIRGDPESIPYDTDPPGGLPLPGESFCGGALVLRARGEGGNDMGMLDLDGAFGQLPRSGTLEERRARAMASSTALRRDLAPIIRVRVVQEAGGTMGQDDPFEMKVFMPSERAEDMAKFNLGVKFLRLGTWDDFSSRDLYSDGTGSIDEIAVEIEKEQGAAVMEPTNEVGSDSQPKEHASGAKASSDDGPTEVPATTEEAAKADGTNGQYEKTNEGALEQEEGGNGDVEDASTREAQSGEEGGVHEETQLSEEETVPLVATDIKFVTFGEGEKADPPEGFELLPEDLSSASVSNFEVDAGSMLGALPGPGVIDTVAIEAEKDKGEGRDEKGDTHSRDRVFLCVKMARYTDSVSPLTDLAVVYGTEGFEMGYGFVTVALPQVVNELYDSTVYLCYKKAGASLAVVQQMAERTAERTAKQVQQHLGIDDGVGDDYSDSVEDKPYTADTSMTPDQMLEWEEKRNRDAAERADKRQQAERTNRRKEASDAVQRQISQAVKEKEELVKQNGDWQKKIASLMLTQQKTREESRTEHTGRGVEKEATPVHESEKNYAGSLAAIVSCRERLQEQQAEYDAVAIALQKRLDEKEFKSREIAESFRDFKREIARTSEHSRTGKAIPKGVISQFEAAETKKDMEIEKVRLKNINLRMMLKKVEGNLRAKEQLAEGLHLIDFEQLKIENQTVNEKIEERNEELLKLRKKNTTTVQILTHTKEKLQFVAAENSVTSHQLSSLEEDLTQERDCLTRAKRDRDGLRREVASLRQSEGFANSDLLILDFEQRKSHLKKLGQKLEEMKNKHHLLLREQERLAERSQTPAAIRLCS